MCVLRFLKWSTAEEISDMCGLRFWAKHELERSDYDKNYPHVDISPQCEWCLAIILFQMCVLRFLKWSRAKEISDMYGLCSAIFFFQMCVLRFFWNEAQLKKSLTCMVCVWPFYFRWAFCVFLKWSRAEEISDIYGLRSAILFQMCVLRFLKWSRAKEISDMYGLCSPIF